MNFLFEKIREGREAWEKMRSTTAALLFILFLVVALYFAWIIYVRLEDTQEIYWQMFGFFLAILSASAIPIGRKHEDYKT